MRARCSLAFAVALVLLFGPAAADDKKPADPPAKEKAKEDKDRELHLIGIYEGYTKSNGQIHGDRAQIQISRPGKKVTLVLVAYKPMTWEVGVSKGTTIEKVILGGYNKAAVKGLPEKVEVVEAFRGSKDAKLPFYTYKIDEPGFRAIVEALDGMTGQKLASFTGMYRAEAESVIAVEDVSDDERFSVDYPQPVPAAKLPKLTFRAHREIPGKYPHEVTRSFGEFTLAGAKADTLVPLPDRASRITHDPVGKKYYGIANHKLAVIDMATKKVKELALGDVPEISWPADVTFDAKRERVLLTTSGGGGYLYAYYPKTEKWEVLAEKPANTIVYHPKDEVVYGLKGDLRGGVPELQEINAKGAVVTSVPLDGPFLPGMFALGPGTGSVQLAAADDKLVMLINPTGLRGSEVPLPKWSYMYLIDQKTGKAQLAWKEKVVK
jgi:hypothetical protein